MHRVMQPRGPAISSRHQLLHFSRLRGGGLSSSESSYPSSCDHPNSLTSSGPDDLNFSAGPSEQEVDGDGKIPYEPVARRGPDEDSVPSATPEQVESSETDPLKTNPSKPTNATHQTAR